MAKIEKALCPFCIFKAKYIDLILTQDGNYVCPNCSATILYEELMHLYSISQLFGLKENENRTPFIE